MCWLQTTGHKEMTGDNWLVMVTSGSGHVSCGVRGTNESITHCRSYSYTLILLYSQFEGNKKEVLLFGAKMSCNEFYRVVK